MMLGGAGFLVKVQKQVFLNSPETAVEKSLFHAITKKIPS